MTAQERKLLPSRSGVIGWGEGGLLAFDAAALDTRITAACVSGYFDDRNKVWKQPVDRNVFGLLEQFGDAEVAAMIAPRSLIIEAARGPEVTMTGGSAYAASQRGRAGKPRDSQAWRTSARNLSVPALWWQDLIRQPKLELVVSDNGTGPFGSEGALSSFLAALSDQARLAPAGPAPERLRPEIDPAERQARQLHELDRHNQWLLTESQYTRQKFMSKLDTSSPEKFRQDGPSLS